MTRQTYKYISISVALLTSIATITFIYFLREKNKIQNPSNVLKEAKSYFMNVKGSFIQGGITQIKNNQQVEYIFYADAKSGEIINIVEL